MMDGDFELDTPRTPSSELRSRLADSIQELDSHLREMRVSSEDILCQVATLDLALQVLEAAKATLLLRLSAVPRTNWTTARFAFEAMHDLFYLLELCPDRGAAGAKIYVGAMVARKRAEGRLRGVPGMGGEGNATSEEPSLREFVRTEAKRIEEIDPGAEQAILLALEEMLDSGEHHWSGLARRKMTKRILERLADTELAARWDAYYYALSLHAHPKLRLGDAIRIGPGRFEYLPDTPDETACHVAFAAVETVLLLVEKHGSPVPKG